MWKPIAYSPSRGRRITSALYGVWTNMRRRCRTDHPAYYRWYKAKGVKCCAEWDDFAAFRAWALANGFRKGLWIDRIDGDGNYEPSNCRWTTRDEQMLNQSHVHQLTLNGVTKPLPVWAREIGINIDVLRSRINNGWSHEHALTIPLGEWRPGLRHKKRGPYKSRRNMAPPPC